MHPRLAQRALVPGALGTGTEVVTRLAEIQSYVETLAATQSTALTISGEAGNTAVLDDDGLYVPTWGDAIDLSRRQDSDIADTTLEPGSYVVTAVQLGLPNAALGQGRNHGGLRLALPRDGHPKLAGRIRKRRDRIVLATVPE